MWLEYTFMTVCFVLVVAGLIMLFIKAQTQWNRYWLIYLTLTLLTGAGFIGLISNQPEFAMIATIPIFVFGILLAMYFGYRLSATGPHHPTSRSGEPLYTQEELRGREGTREAIRIYMLVLIIVFTVVALVYYLFSLLA